MSKIAILFVLTCIGAIVFSVFSSVAWSIYLYQLLYYLNPVNRWWYGQLPHIRYSFITAVLIIVLYIFNYHKFVNNKLFVIPMTKWLILMISTMGIVSFYAAWPEKHFIQFITFLKVIVFIFIAYKIIDTPGKFEKMIWAFLTGCFYIGWVAHSLGRTYDGRLEGVGMADGINANDTAAGIIPSIPILLFYLLNGKWWQKIISVGFLAYIMDGVVLLNSRGAFLGIVAGCGYMFINILLHGNLKQVVKMSFVLSFGIGLFLFLADITFLERMGTIVSDVQTRTGGATRTFFWMKTFDLVKEHPFGVGFWGYQFHSPQFIPEEWLSEGMRAVHSTYFELFAEYGYLSFLFFPGLIFSTFSFGRLIKKHIDSGENLYLKFQLISIEAGLIAYMVAVTFIDRLYAEIFYWLFLFIMCFGNIYYLKGNTDLKGDVIASKQSQE